MRGKEIVGVVIQTVLRITPAYAGKSSRSVSWICAFWDHPRLCGEKIVFHVPMQDLKGSPPPMRGKDLPFDQLPRGRRITPAYAGKSSGIRCSDADRQDHPRLCGEKRRFLASGFRGKGSPPPMRGKDNKPFHNKFLHGITPAYAGKSFSDCSFCLLSWDHPRLCGEKDQIKAGKHAAGGSPPPMRGKGLNWNPTSFR